MDPATGAITGTTSATGKFDFTVTAYNTYGCSAPVAFSITIVPAFVAVTNITGVPTTATAGSPLTLTGTVAPTTATNQTIAWSLKSAGTTGATLSGSTLNTTAAGTVVVTATIVNGLTASTPYTQDFTITVSAGGGGPVAPTITGPSSMTLTAGYAATSTGVYTVTGTAPVTVTKTSGNAKITWNATTMKLDIAAGLPVGMYPVVLTASNGTAPDATITFTLTVIASGGGHIGGGGGGGSNWTPYFLPPPIVSGLGTTTPAPKPVQQVKQPFPAAGNAAASIPVRATASGKGKKIATLKKGTEVTVLGYENGFWKIAWDNDAGYAYVSADAMSVMLGAGLEMNISGTVYVQSKMNTAKKYRVATLGDGDTVKVYGRYKTWWVVSAADYIPGAAKGQAAYVKNGKYIKP
jgi:hypothetical protein